MRTTLTLDEDVTRRLKAETRRTGKPFRVVVNECLRAALSSRARRGAGEPPFVVQASWGARSPDPSWWTLFLAALALENGATLATTDRDFARFPRLRLLDPAA